MPTKKKQKKTSKVLNKSVEKSNALKKSSTEKKVSDKNKLKNGTKSKKNDTASLSSNLTVNQLLKDQNGITDSNDLYADSIHQTSDSSDNIPITCRGIPTQNSFNCDDFEVLTIPNGCVEIKNCIDEDSSDDNDSFFDELFLKNTPTFITTPTDTFPCEDESNPETKPLECEVKFFIDKCRSIAMAEYEGDQYRVGFLDLFDDEHSHLKLISQTSVLINVKSNHILIHEKKFNIKRINERRVPQQFKTNISLESFYEYLNLGRIQFSTTEPFLAKYEDDIYFVGHTLYDEYCHLLNRTGKRPGTAIRIGNDRLRIDLSTQTLDICQSVSFKHQNEICIIKGDFDWNKVQDDYPLNGCRRYVICDKPWLLLEVEPELLHSSIYDDCTEIYAEIDFPFDELERVEKVVKKINISLPPKQTTKSTKPRKGRFEDEMLEMVELKSYAVPKEIKEATGTKRRAFETLKRTKFNQLLEKKTLRSNLTDYVNGSRMMIYLEEEANAFYLKKFDQTNIRLTYHMDRQFYFPITEALVELAAAIEENVLDRLVLHPKSAKQSIEIKIYGQVYRSREHKIFIEINQESFRHIKTAWRNELYDISFLLNRMPYQIQQYALQFVETEDLFTKLIDNSYYKCKTPSLVLPHKQNTEHVFKTKGTMLSDLNAEQQVAVKNIIGKTDKLPYILFGPPGTGKTRTIVAAIEQIVRTTKQNVLVCTMSNAACDEITNRLIDVLDETELYRFYAKSYRHERISARIKTVSNFENENIVYPPLGYLYKFRVFVCTLCSAGCLTRARKDKEVWKATHFSYVFIDECASAHETMCLVPIAGLCTSKREIHAKIILAGDPKQLDAVTRSDVARKMGHNTSWMEKLCDSNLYMRKAGKFNELYITQLVKNYRSHPEILRIPNELFYENSLESCAKKDDIDWFIDSNFLPSKKFPMIFKSVQGECQRSLEHSWFNEDEVNEIVKNIKALLPSAYTNKNPKEKKLQNITQNDIGVVTPYRKQRHKISQKLRRLGYDEVTVGTAEVFQGKEKPIMIVSTVRSNGELGFVAEPRRLNVVITRAKCLVIIVGDPHTLSINAHWFRVIQHCIQNNSFVQGSKAFTLTQQHKNSQNKTKTKKNKKNNKHCSSARLI